MPDDFEANKAALLNEINRFSAYCDKWWDHNSKTNKVWFFAGIGITTICAIISLSGDSLMTHAGVVGGIGTLLGTAISTVGRSLKYDRKAVWYGTACSTLNAWKVRIELRARKQEDLDGIVDLLEKLEASEPSDQPDAGTDFDQLYKTDKPSKPD